MLMICPACIEGRVLNPPLLFGKSAIMRAFFLFPVNGYPFRYSQGTKQTLDQVKINWKFLWFQEVTENNKEGGYRKNRDGVANMPPFATVQSRKAATLEISFPTGTAIDFRKGYVIFFYFTKESAFMDTKIPGCCKPVIIIFL